MDYYLEAEYESGYVHSNQYQDVSPYAKTVKVDGVPTGPNIFNDIKEKRPEEAHGPMVRFSLVGPETTYNINWREVPESGRPVFVQKFEQDFINGIAVGPKRTTRTTFGYQYNDADGKNVKELINL